MDECLQQSGDQLCGETDHFTNFAVLIGGTGSSGKSDPCASSQAAETDDTILWLSLAAVLTALACCCILIPVLEILRRLEKKQRKARIRNRQNARRSEFLRGDKSSRSRSSSSSNRLSRSMDAMTRDDEMQVLV